MKKYILLLAVLLVLCLGLSRAGYGGLPFEGTWTATGGDAEFGWYKTYTFKGGEYTLDAYPPLREMGEYKVLWSTDNRYTVLLEPLEGEAGLAEFVMLEDGTFSFRNYMTTGGLTFGPANE